MRNVPIHIDFKGKHLIGVADPINSQEEYKVPLAHSIYKVENILALLPVKNRVGF
jgi:hypothetical protein